MGQNGKKKDYFGFEVEFVEVCMDTEQCGRGLPVISPISVGCRDTSHVVNECTSCN